MATYNGTSARNVWNGTASADTAHGNGGDDTLNGLGGNDSLYGDSGNDGLYGGIGNDRVWGGTGIDALSGQDGDDQLYGEAGDDYILGGIGNDYLHGGSGNDRLRGEDGNDRMDGGPGVDDLVGGNGSDYLILATANTAYSRDNAAVERLDGGSGSDVAYFDVTGSTVDGLPTKQINISYDSPGKYFVTIGSDAEEGNAVLASASNIETFVMREDGPALFFLGNVGSPGLPDNATINVTGTNQADEFVGGRENSNVNLMGGNDTAIISVGKDTVTLGAGSDTVHFKEFYNGPRNGTVTDFKPGEDTLLLDGWSKETLKVTEDIGGTWLKGEDDSLYLLGVHGYDSISDFIV